MIAALPATAGARDARGLEPLGSPGDWIRSEDYPVTALEDDTEGIVGFSLAVDASGRPVKCTVTLSSGSDALDSATCNLVTLRATFSPATDRRGRAVPDTYVSRVRWVLPKQVPQPRAYDMIASFTVDEEGNIGDCKRGKSDGYSPAELARMGNPCGTMATTRPFLDADGRPVRRRVVWRATQTIEPVD